MDLLLEQIRLEEEAREEHRARWLDNMQDNMQEGRANSLPLIYHMMCKAFPLVVQGITDIVNDTARGYGAQYRTYMREVGINTCAGLALNMAVSGACKVSPITQLLSQMGKAVISEAIYNRGVAQGPLTGTYMMRLADDIKRAKTMDADHIYGKTAAAAKKIGVDLDTLPTQAFITIGKLLMQAVQPTGLVQIVRKGGSAKMKATAHLELHPDVLVSVKDWMGLPTSDGSCYPPLIIPPAQIAPDGKSGMWHSPGQNATYRVISKMWSRSYMALKIDPTPVIEPCMELASVPYRVNPMVLEFLRNNHSSVMGLPVEPVKPRVPFNIPEGVTFKQYVEAFDKELRTKMESEAQAYKVDTRMYYGALRKFYSQMMGINSAIAEGAKYAKYDKIYLPTFADMRGRIYYSSHLNPQGGDAQRALLELADGVPLGDSGLYWLKVHVANCAGFDSESFDKRAKYTDDMLPRLREACRLPEAYDSFWAAWDYPLCGWAAASELLRALDSGNPAAFPSRTITQWDATCSGLQHFSALLRDEVGGAAVNLTDSPEKKADIYLKTAAVALSDVLAAEACNRTTLGQWLLKHGIERSMAKKPVMTFVYGATNRGMQNYFAEYIRSEHIELPPTYRLLQCATFVADIMFGTVPKVVPKAAACMTWLQRIAHSQAVLGEYMWWVAPSGLRCVNMYESFKNTTMQLNLMGLRSISIRQYTNKPDSRRATMAISPNFVHSMDASHMMRVLWQMWNRGVYMVSVHDSFGCAAAHAGEMHKVIREEFVKMYTEFDPLQQIADRYSVEKPECGKLDINSVLTSSHFFC